MGAAAEAAIGAGNDVLAADDRGVVRIRSASVSGLSTMQGWPGKIFGAKN